MKQKNYVKQEWWDKQYETYDLQIVPENNWLRQWFESVIPAVSSKKTKDCIEIGCYPGRYLAVMGLMGYRVNGIDRAPGIEDKLPYWFEQQGISVGSFYREDFFTFDFQTKYDLVYSIGFIEHYKDWSSVIEAHAKLVKDNGYLVLTVPNFRGSVQWILHRLLDNQNLKRHNIESMRPYEWANILKKNGFEIMQAGYVGDFLIWVDRQERNYFQKKFLELISRWQKNRTGSLNHEGVAATAPYCTLVARRF